MTHCLPLRRSHAFLRVSVFSFIFSGNLGLINFGLDLDHYHIHPIYFGISSIFILSILVSAVLIDLY